MLILINLHFIIRNFIDLIILYLALDASATVAHATGEAQQCSSFPIEFAA